MRKILAALLVLPAAIALADEWEHYVNARFGVAADVPPGFESGPAPENGDGQSFIYPDGQLQISVWGRALDPETSFAEHVSEAERFFREDGGRITYRAGQGGWAVFSGFTKGGHIAYLRMNRACDGAIAHHVSLEYPPAQKQRFDAIVARVQRSLATDPGHTCE